MAKKCPECPKAGPKWLTTFSDLTTLLLTFFVLLISMAVFDKIKIEQVFGFLSGSRGVLKFDGKSEMNPVTIMPNKGQAESTVKKTQEKLEKTIKDVVQSQNLEKLVSIIKTDKGISVRVMDSVFFRPDSSVLLPEAFPILNKIVDLVEGTPYYINVEGHTDSDGTKEDANLNWDLSAARAISVVKYFIRQGFNPVKLSASGYGQFHPILPNITNENKAKNRRVEINIVTPEFAESGKNTFEE